MKKGYVLSVLLIIPFLLNAQSFYSVRRDRSLIVVAGTGTSSYLGELKNPGEYLDPKLHINTGLQYYFTNRISITGELTYFTLKGTDAKADDGSRKRRNLSFTSGNFELSIIGAVNILPNGHRFYQRPKINFYPFVGVGLAYINPKAELNGKKYALQPLQTEGVKYSRFQPVIPYGVGARIKAGPFFNIGLEAGWRLTFTDYLDDVSTVYPDPASFDDPVAAALSMRYETPVPPGTQRGNPDRNDAYFLLNVRLEYYLPYNFLAANQNRKLYNSKRKAYYRRP